MRTSAQPLRTVAIQHSADARSAKYTAIFADTSDTPCPAAPVCDTADTADSADQRTVYSALHPTSATAAPGVAPGVVQPAVDATTRKNQCTLRSAPPVTRIVEIEVW